MFSIKSKSLIIVLFTFFFYFQAVAQKDKVLSVKELRSDFDDLLEFMEAFPDPYSHISEADFHLKCDSIKATLDKPLTRLEFYSKASYVVALLKDGHSSVYLPRFWMSKQREENGALPMEFHLANDDKLYVLKSYGHDSIPPGAQVLSINGMSINSFLNEIDPYISYELKQFRNTRIDDDFEKYLYMVFDHSDSTVFEYLSDKKYVKVVRNIPVKEWRGLVKDEMGDRERQMKMQEPYSFEKVANGIGILKIYSFSTSNFQSYELFLEKTFRNINKEEIHSLILDVRGNYGGWPKIASGLFHYISDSHFKTLAVSEMKVSNPYKKRFLDIDAGISHANFGPANRHYIDINAILNNPVNTIVTEDFEFNEDPFQEVEEFYGDCYLLTNRDSYSAASSFASTFQCYGMGLVIGEETGGTKVFRANPIYKELNKSSISIAMATTKLYTTCFDEEFKGVMPHVQYSPTIFQLVSGMDTQLEYTKYLINKIQRDRLKAAQKN